MGTCYIILYAFLFFWIISLKNKFGIILLFWTLSFVISELSLVQGVEKRI